MLEIYGSPRDGSGKPLHISGLLSRLLPAAPEGVEVRLQDMVLYKFSQVSALLYLPCQATVYRGFLRNACLAAGPAATPPRSPGTRFPWRAPSACSRSCGPVPFAFMHVRITRTRDHGSVARARGAADVRRSGLPRTHACVFFRDILASVLLLTCLDISRHHTRSYPRLPSAQPPRRAIAGGDTTGRGAHGQAQSSGRLGRLHAREQCRHQGRAGAYD